MEYTKDEVWEYLEMYGIATNEELQLVTDINGYSMETLMDVIYARTGYRNMEQLTEAYGNE